MLVDILVEKLRLFWKYQALFYRQVKLWKFISISRVLGHRV